jgi:signal transduction histidine kinase
VRNAKATTVHLDTSILSRVDSSITRVHGGVGLGLHIIRAFTEMLGGTIAVKSVLNKGSTFTLTLPV